MISTRVKPRRARKVGEGEGCMWVLWRAPATESMKAALVDGRHERTETPRMDWRYGAVAPPTTVNVGTWVVASCVYV